MSDTLIFNFLRRKKREWSRNTRAVLTQAEVNEANAVLTGWKGSQGAKTTAAPVSAAATLSEASGGITSRRGPLAAIVGTLAATSLFATVPQEEGIEYKAYRDIAGIWTICAGDTSNVRAGMIETPEGCRQRLERQLVAHAKPVMQATPRLSEPGRDWQRAAAVSLAYNIGVGAYSRSSVDRHFDAGRWRQGCDAFLLWDKAKVRGQLRPVLGLTRRRQRERELCLRGIT